LNKTEQNRTLIFFKSPISWGVMSFWYFTRYAICIKKKVNVTKTKTLLWSGWLLVRDIHWSLILQCRHYECYFVLLSNLLLFENVFSTKTAHLQRLFKFYNVIDIPFYFCVYVTLLEVCDTLLEVICIINNGIVWYLLWMKLYTWWRKSKYVYMFNKVEHMKGKSQIN